MKSNIQLKYSNYVAFSHDHGFAVNNSGLKKSDSRKRIAAPIIDHNLSAELLLPTKGSVLHMIQHAKDTPPFSRADAAYYNGRVEHIFSEEGIQNTLAYVQAAAVVGLLATFNEQFRQGVGITKIITLAEELPATIRNYKSGMAAYEQLSYKEQWYLEKRNAICMTCGRVSPLSTQSTFEDLAVDFEGTTASGAERFYRRTLDKLRLKLLESGLIHTVTLKQTECRKRNKKIAAAVYLYQADNDGEWGELRFDFENGTAEIVRLADWDTVKSNIFAKTAIRFAQGLPETRLLKSTVVPFEMERLDLI